MDIAMDSNCRRRTRRLRGVLHSSHVRRDGWPWRQLDRANLERYVAGALAAFRDLSDPAGARQLRLWWLFGWALPRSVRRDSDGGRGQTRWSAWRVVMGIGGGFGRDARIAHCDGRKQADRPDTA